MNKKYRNIMITKVLCLVLTLTVLAASTYAWYSANLKVSSTDEVGSAAASKTEYALGHDTYMWDLDDEKGALKNNETVVMNQFDTLFVENNRYTPIILRAVLSSDFAAYAAAGQSVTLSLTSLPIETIKTNNASADLFSEDTSDAGGYGIRNYLSNVVNVRAAYIPGLAENADNGNYAALDADHTYADCQDADDYIYQYAVDFFDVNSSDISPVQFVTTKTEDPKYVTTTKTTYVVTPVTNSNFSVTASTTASSGSTTTSKVYELQGYLIGNGTNFLGVSGTSLTNTNFSGAGTYTSAIDSSILWQRNSGTVQIASGGTLYNAASSRYLYLNRGWNSTYSLTANTNSTNWTISAADAIYSNNRYVYCNNGTWSVTTASASANTTIYKVEKCTETITTSVPVYSYDHEITIDVDLNQAQADDGNYYVYLMLDYDQDLVNSYFDHNGIRFALGEAGIEFEDYFSIEPKVSSD